jgi:hypothetical protein
VIPALPANTNEYRFPETTIPANTETMTCAFLEPTTEDQYVTALTSYQGKFGHHLVIFKAVVKEEAGAVRLCNTGADMTNLIPILSSVNFGLAKFPDGMAVFVPKGTQVVLQQHVVNTGDRPVVTHDAVHVTRASPADVKTISGFYGLSDVTFNIAPQEQETTLTFECEVPQDMKVLLMGPHMHEWGTRFKAWAGAKASPAKIIDVPVWEAQFRDEPPAIEFPKDAPLALKKGDIVRTACTFKNTTGEPIKFPKEMCATYGYYYPATTGEEWICGATSVSSTGQ